MQYFENKNGSYRSVRPVHVADLRKKSWLWPDFYLKSQDMLAGISIHFYNNFTEYFTVVVKKKKKDV